MINALIAAGLGGLATACVYALWYITLRIMWKDED